MNIFFNLLLNIARANTSFEGIDYTFRRKFDSIFYKDNKEEINRIKQRKNEIQINQHIFDLEKTILLNQEIINKIIPSLTLKENEKQKLLNSVSAIYNYFNKKKEYRQNIKSISGKILMNKQIIEEIKRRKDEVVFFHTDQIHNMEASVTKKGGAVKLFQKKFNEVEIFIQNESKSIENEEKYGKWKSFTIIPFMKKNEDLLKRKCFYEQEVNKLKEKIELIEKESNSIEENNKIIKNNKNIINDNDKSKYIENYYNNNSKLYENSIKFWKIKLNILSDCNIKKSIIPSFKTKNPISNLNVNLNLIGPGTVELELNLKKVMESEEIKFDEKEHIKKMNNELNLINDKFEKEIGKELKDENTKGNEIKPQEDDNWGKINNEFENISDIENEN